MKKLLPIIIALCLVLALSLGVVISCSQKPGGGNSGNSFSSGSFSSSSSDSGDSSSGGGEQGSSGDSSSSSGGEQGGTTTTITAEIELLDKDVLANVTLKYAVCGECSRCLEAARGCVEHSFFAKFSLNPNAEEGEYRYSSGKVDLTAAVNEELILSAPATIYCKPDCKGLCPVCGANRNLCDCGHCD